MQTARARFSNMKTPRGPATKTKKCFRVCRRCSRNEHDLSQLENGGYMPTLETILKLAAAIGCKPTDLLTPFNAADLRSLLEK